MAKKKSDKPKAVCLPLDRLSIQVGFMDYVRAGYLFKMIVYYCMGDNEMLERLKKEIKGMSDHSLVEMAFEENKAIIDANLAKYAETCEKRRLAVQKREEYRQLRLSNDNQMTSNDNKSSQVIANTNTDTITKTSTNTITDTKTNTDTNSSSFHSEENVCVSEGEKTHTPAPAPTKEEQVFNNFVFRLRREYPSVASLQLPTLEQLTDIYVRSGRNWDAVFNVCADMENKADLTKKYKVFFTTFNNFSKHMSK